MPGERPADQVNNPTGSNGLIAVDKLGSRVMFLTPNSLEELVSFPTADRPHEVAISPDHRRAYVSIYGSGVFGNNPRPGQKLLVVDLESRRPVSEIDLAPFLAPHGLMFGQDGLLYVSCDHSGVVAVVDPASERLAGSIETDSHGCHMIAMAEKLYAENEDDRPFVSVLSVTDRQLVARVPMPNGAAGIVSSPDGRTVLVTDNKEPELAVIDTRTDETARRIRLRRHQLPAQRVRYSPSGQYVVVTSMEEPLVTVLDLQSDNQQTIPVAAGPMGMAFHPDGETAVVANHNAGRLTVLNLPAARVQRELDAGRGVETLAFY